MGASGNIQISFRCYYNIEDIENTIAIINSGYLTLFENEELDSKIRILNGNKKEKLGSGYKKFDKTGINSVDFIVEGKLTNMSYIFIKCESLKKVEFISIDTSKVTSMNQMFSGCNSLESVDLSNFNTSNVENMEKMFEGCSKLKEIKGLNNFNTSNLYNMCYMFSGCNSLEYLDISNVDFSSIRHAEKMFVGCSKLKEIKGITNITYKIIPNITKGLNIQEMFEGCKELKELDHLIIYNNKITIDTSRLLSKFNISVLFISIDRQIKFTIPCNILDKFSTLEEKLFNEFPELKTKNIKYLVNDTVVDKSKTLKENNIKNTSTTIIIDCTN